MDEERQTRCHRTICNLYTNVTAFLRFCGIDHKKLLPVHERPTPVDEDPEAYTEEELQRFFFDIVDERHRLGYKFMLVTGARETEMSKLEWPQVRLGAAPTVTFLTKEERRIKNGRSRSVPLEKKFAEELAAWRDRNPTTVLVFGTVNNKPDGKWWERCKKIATRAGMDPQKFGLHKFRNTYATQLARRGVDIRQIQILLGHASITETQRYLAPMEGAQAQAAINRVFGDLNLSQKTLAPEIQ